MELGAAAKSKEVRAARKREVRHTPHRNPITHIWHDNEFPICRAFNDTILSKDFPFPFPFPSIALWLFILSSAKFNTTYIYILFVKIIEILGFMLTENICKNWIKCFRIKRVNNSKHSSEKKIGNIVFTEWKNKYWL